MGSNYFADPTAGQSPSRQPLPGEVPEQVLPADGDTLNVASVLQALKVPADYNAALISQPGRIRTFQENFYLGSNFTFGTPVTSSQTLSSTTSCAVSGSGSSVTVHLPDTTFGGPFLSLTAGGASGRYAAINSLVPYDTDMTTVQFCLEQEISISDPTVGDYFFGMATASGAAPPNNLYPGLYHTHTDTDWKLNYNNGSFHQVTVPSSAPAAFSHQVLRLVFSGSATPIGIANGNKPVVRVFINDATMPALTVADTFYTGVVYPGAYATATGAGGAVWSLAAPCAAWNSRL